MYHTRRRWCVHDREEVEEFAREITGKRTWCLCNGIRWQGLLILNDSTSEDALQEYAVINEKTGVQVESLTVSWLTPFNLGVTLTELANGRYSFSMGNKEDPLARIETPEQHRQRRCELCA